MATRFSLFLFGLFSLMFILDSVFAHVTGKGPNLDSGSLGLGIGMIGLVTAVTCWRLDQRLTRIEKGK